MSASININVSKSGVIKIHGIKGTFGPSCEKLTETLEKHGKLLKKEKTADYYKDGDPKVHIDSQVSK